MASMTFVPNYDWHSWFYEAVAELYSLGAIRRAKRSQRRFLKPTSHVLVIGCGAGEDVVEFAPACEQVTAVDVSCKMLGRLQRKLTSRKIGNVETVHTNLFDYRPARQFDSIHLNFFLNCFPETTVREVLNHIHDWIAPGGRVHIADFAPVQSRDTLIQMFSKQVSYRIANIFYAVQGVMALHPLYDYAPTLKSCGYAMCEYYEEPTLTNYFRWYANWVATPVLSKVENALDTNGQRHEESEFETAVRENPSDGGSP